MFSFVDMIGLSIALILIGSGFYFGFIRSLGNVIGWIVGLLVSAFVSIYALANFDWMQNPIYAILLFFLLFAFVSALVGWLANIIAGIWKFAKWIPFTKTINTLSGGVLGAIEAFLALVGLDGFVRYALPFSAVQQAFIDSIIFSTVRTILTFLQPILQTLFL